MLPYSKCLGQGKDLLGLLCVLVLQFVRILLQSLVDPHSLLVLALCLQMQQR